MPTLDENGPPTMTRYCALCGQCEACMTRLEEQCWDNNRGDHLWNQRAEPHRIDDA